MAKVIAKDKRIEAAQLVLSERVVATRRVSKVVKGGRKMRFNALVVVGDGEGVVGVGLGKAITIPDAVRKGNYVAKRSLIRIPLKGSTIPQKTLCKTSASIVLIKPAPVGTGLIAAAAVRAVLDLAGVKDVVAKTLGSRNPINVVYATMDALRQLRDPDEEMRRRGMGGVINGSDPLLPAKVLG
jgi:small subunit ribosomal protein S5